VTLASPRDTPSWPLEKGRSSCGLRTPHASPDGEFRDLARVALNARQLNTVAPLRRHRGGRLVQPRRLSFCAGPVTA
jgi:hypothetical protein